MPRNSTSAPVLDVDVRGNSVVDPTHNVLKLVEEAVKRIDDLQKAEIRRLDDLRSAESKRLDEQAVIRENYAEKLRSAEEKRIDAIRAVDVNNVAVANEKTTQQATVLARQLSETIASFNTQMNTLTTLFSDRIAKVEKEQYENAGKTTIIDPMLGDIRTDVKELLQSRSGHYGESAGRKDLLGWLFGAVGVIIAIITFLLKN